MAPRTDPSERNYRTGLLPRVFGVKALVWMRMHDFERGNPQPDDRTEGLPVDASLLASATEHLEPVTNQIFSKRPHGFAISWHRMIPIVPEHHPLQPVANLGYGVMHAPA